MMPRRMARTDEAYEEYVKEVQARRQARYTEWRNIMEKGNPKAIYATVSVASDGRRATEELALSPLTSVSQVKAQAQVEGEWLYVRRLTNPTGIWVWKPDGTQSTVREMRRNFGWTHA